MRINMSDLNPPVWFEMEDGDGRVLIKLAEMSLLEEIRKKTSTKMPPEYRRGARYEIPDKVDEKKYNELLWDATIIDWENLEDENDVPIPCTTENKIKLMNNSVLFVNFITECLEKLRTNQAKYQEEAEKNSSTSQSVRKRNHPAKSV